jgi:Ice-binding-like
MRIGKGWVLLILLRRSKYDYEVNKMRRSVMSFGLAALVVLIWPATALAATDPGLKTAGHFAVLAGTTVTAALPNGPSWISGELGVWPGSAVTGFPPSVASGAQHKGDAVAQTAQTDLTGAYTRAMNAPCPGTHNFTGVNLGGKILVPGVYCQTTAPTLTGTLTLNGSGAYIFQIGSTLVAEAGSRVRLIGGAQPCDIFWQVSSSATLRTTSAFVGNIMALTSIAMQTGATLEGRALARNGAVTLDDNRIIQPGGCGFSAPAVGTPPVGNNLPFSLGFSLSLASTGIPLELRGSFPWLLVIGAGGGLGAIALGVSSARRRRRTT